MLQLIFPYLKHKKYNLENIYKEKIIALIKQVFILFLILNFIMFLMVEKVICKNKINKQTVEIFSVINLSPN